MCRYPRSLDATQGRARCARHSLGLRRRDPDISPIVRLSSKFRTLPQDALEIAGVHTMTGQPTNTQSENGTIVHRRWRAARIGNAGRGASIPVQIQRERDQGTPVDEAIPFGLAVTVEMPGAVQVYDQVLPSIKTRPRTRVQSR